MIKNSISYKKLAPLLVKNLKLFKFIVMKNSLLFALILCSNFLFSQDFVGAYSHKSEPVNAGPIVYNLKLNADFTYEISIHRRFNKELGPDEYFKGQGTWKQEKHKILFFPESCECDNEIDLTDTTSRFKSKNSTELVFFNFNGNWSLNVGLSKQ